MLAEVTQLCYYLAGRATVPSFILSSIICLEHRSHSTDLPNVRRREVVLFSNIPNASFTVRGATFKICGTICRSCRTRDCLGAISAPPRVLSVLIVGLSSSPRSMKERVSVQHPFWQRVAAERASAVDRQRLQLQLPTLLLSTYSSMFFQQVLTYAQNTVTAVVRQAVAILHVSCLWRVPGTSTLLSIIDVLCRNKRVCPWNVLYILCQVPVTQPSTTAALYGSNIQEVIIEPLLVKQPGIVDSTPYCTAESVCRQLQTSPS